MSLLDNLFQTGSKIVKGVSSTIDELFAPSGGSGGLKTTTPMMTNQGTSGNIGAGLVDLAYKANKNLNTPQNPSMVDIGTAVGPMAIAGVAKRVGTPLVKAGSRKLKDVARLDGLKSQYETINKARLNAIQSGKSKRVIKGFSDALTGIENLIDKVR